MSRDNKAAVPITDVNVQVQSTMYMALNGIFGSQNIFLFNSIQATWQDSSNGFVRLAILTYTSAPVDSMNQVF